MNVCVLMGSPRVGGNTAELCKPFIEELRQRNAAVEYITLHGKDIAPCLGCNCCQDVADDYGCVQRDDMQAIVAAIMRADVLVLATPIYSWQATPPLKAVMDRLFGMNKFYGNVPRKTLYPKLSYALISTCGYEIEYGASLLDEAVRRGCAHSELPYLGMYAVRDVDGISDFQTEEARAGARAFARKIMREAAV